MDVLIEFSPEERKKEEKNTKLRLDLTLHLLLFLRVLQSVSGTQRMKRDVMEMSLKKRRPEGLFFDLNGPLESANISYSLCPQDVNKSRHFSSQWIRKADKQTRCFRDQRLLLPLRKHLSQTCPLSSDTLQRVYITLHFSWKMLFHRISCQTPSCD